MAWEYVDDPIGFKKRWEIADALLMLGWASTNREACQLVEQGQVEVNHHTVVEPISGVKYGDYIRCDRKSALFIP